MTYEIAVPFIALAVAGLIAWLSFRDTKAIDKRLAVEKRAAK